MKRSEYNGTGYWVGYPGRWARELSRPVWWQAGQRASRKGACADAGAWGFFTREATPRRNERSREGKAVRSGSPWRRVWERSRDWCAAWYECSCSQCCCSTERLLPTRAVIVVLPSRSPLPVLDQGWSRVNVWREPSPAYNRARCSRRRVSGPSVMATNAGHGVKRL